MSSEERDQLSRKISDLASQASHIQSETMRELSQDISSINTNLDSLAVKFRNLRSKGYVYGAVSERQLQDFKERWTERKRNVEEQLNSISRELRYKYDDVEREIRDLRDLFESDYRDAESRYSYVEQTVNNFKRYVEAEEDRIEALYKDIEQGIEKIKKELDEIEWAFNELAKSSVKLHQGEELIFACKGQHLEDRKKQGPKGTIFLTSNRFLFEQNEDIVVSRTLIFFTKKEHVQKIVIDKPIGALGSIKDTEQGWLFKAELLDVSFRDQAGDMLFKLDKDSTMIKELIRRIVEGHIDTERIGSGSTGAGAVKETVTPVAPAVPTNNQIAESQPPVQQVERLAPREIRCPGCGAVYDKPLLKGMTSDECPYCSTTIRF
ncbi:MAG: hypothetical protein ABRQ38_06010 [Candidatus Eremiobacterota bacterium]